MTISANYHGVVNCQASTDHIIQSRTQGTESHQSASDWRIADSRFLPSFGNGTNITPPSSRSGYLLSVLQVPQQHRFSIFEALHSYFQNKNYLSDVRQNGGRVPGDIITFTDWSMPAVTQISAIRQLVWGRGVLGGWGWKGSGDRV